MFVKTAKEIAEKTCQDAGVLVMRIALGSFFLFHGAQKLFGTLDGLGLGGYANLIEALQLPFPQYVSVAIAATEFFGGLLLMLGMYSRTAACLLSLTLFASGYYVYQNMVDLNVDRITYPLNLAYLLTGLGFALVGLAITGPGRFSVGTLLALRKSIVPRRKTETVLG